MAAAPESRWVRRALAVGAGALPALAFPEPALWWLAYPALVPWLLLARSAGTGRQAAVTGWLGGTGFMLAVHHWLLPSLHVFMLLLTALLGLLWAPWGWLVRRLLHGRPGAGRLAAAVVLVPAGWLMVELVRSWEYLGGPWGLLGASQWQVPPALRLASVGGVWLVSFLLVGVNTALAALIAVPAAAQEPSRVTATADMVEAASALLATVAGGPGGTEALLGFDKGKNLALELDDEARQDWAYWPTERVGVPLDLMTGEQRRLTHALLTSLLSARGYLKVMQLMQLEQILGLLDTAGLPRGV
ncbi:MAG: DUF3500 domain-containing protein, partial [Streptomyces sp.]|uniref:DUF3500 domain-containing protein n=1 Tax=Streptomyces sp. TaxID=1931 RepID=UPI003D6B136D